MNLEQLLDLIKWRPQTTSMTGRYAKLLRGFGGDVNKMQQALLQEERDSGMPVGLNAQLYAKDPQAQDVFDKFLKGYEESAAAGAEAGDTTSGGIFQSGESITLPPILEMLAEMRVRRDTNRVAAEKQLQASGELAPRLAPSEFMPGFEQGGLADVMAGILSGKGKNHGMLTPEMRKPKQLPVDLGLLSLIGQQEPGISADMPDAVSLAKMIFDNAIRTPTYSSYGGGSSSSASSEGEGDIEAQLSALLGI